MSYPYDPKAFKCFAIYEAMHAPLLARYHLRSQSHEPVGVASTYGREDPETGGFYTVTANEEFDRKTHKHQIMISTDYQCGAFYPATIFIEGHGLSQGECLLFEDLEEFQRKFWNADTKRVITPRGWDPKRGGWTWRNGLQYFPHNRPTWNSVETKLREKFPDGQINMDPRGNYLTIALGLHEAFPSTNPRVGEFVLAAFLASEQFEDLRVGDSHADPLDAKAVFVHGSWEIHMPDGLIWGTDDGEKGGKHEFKFYQHQKE